MRTADCVALRITTYKPRIGELCKYTEQQVYQKSSIQGNCWKRCFRLAQHLTG